MAFIWCKKCKKRSNFNISFLKDDTYFLTEGKKCISEKKKSNAQQFSQHIKNSFIKMKPSLVIEIVLNNQFDIKVHTKLTHLKSVFVCISFKKGRSCRSAVTFSLISIHRIITIFRDEINTSMPDINAQGGKMEIDAEHLMNFLFSF